MANKFHRLATQGELHRPERTGVGNPNRLTLDFLEDGQYYQDVTTGAVYRFNIPYGDTNTANGSWELLIAYDRSLGSITNIGASLTGSIVGITTEEISSDSATDLVSSIPAYMYTQLREGEDIRVIDSSNISNYASFTINSDVNAGIVNVEVQEMYLSTPLPAQSSITVEGAIYTAYNSMDPTKIQLGVERRDLGDSIGTLSANITNGTAGVTTIELKDIDPTVNIEDNQKLILKNRAGNYDILTANGAQNLESNTGTVTVDSFIPVYDYLVDQAFLYEPSYGSSSRLTLAANSISLLTQQVSDVGNSVAGLNLYVQNNFASATLFAEFQDNTNTSISQLELNATAQQSSLELLSSFQTDATNALATINATTNTQGATISLLTQYADSANTAFSSINTFAGTTNSSISILNGYTDGANTAFASINSTTNALGAELVLKVDSNGNVASVELGSNADGTSIALNADQIDINNIEFNKDGGTIGSNNYVANTSGWIINGNGDAEFNQIAVRNGIISGGSIQDGATLSNLTITGELSMGTNGVITNANDDFKIENTGISLVDSDTVGTTDADKIKFYDGAITGSPSAFIQYFKTAGVPDTLYLSSDADITLNSISNIRLNTGTVRLGTTLVTSNTTAMSFEIAGGQSAIKVNDASDNGFQIGVGAGGDTFIAPIIAGSSKFGRELIYDISEDSGDGRWEFDDDLYVGGVFTNPSDQRYKENIEPLQNSLDNLMSLQTVKYDMKDFLPNDDRRMIGVFAQEVEQFYPEAVSNGSITDEDGNDLPLKSVSYTQLVPILIHAIQELKQQLDDRTGTT